jgi:trk system potassium uptake protein TrkH
VLIGGFAVAILVGTLLLTLPVASAGARIGLLDALFTATSAVCVTGLTVRDTGREFSTFGQVVILSLVHDERSRLWCMNRADTELSLDLRFQLTA